MAGFAAIVGDWVSEMPERINATWRLSLDKLAAELVKTKQNGGKLPHLTGNLMRSLLASTSGPPTNGGKDQKYAGSDVGLVTAQSTTSDTVWFGYQAIYARRMNYGFVGEDSLGRTYNQAGNHFVEDAIGQWPDLVKASAEEIRNGRS